MTKENRLSDFHYRLLGKILHTPFYNLPERFAPKLIDAGYIIHEKWSELYSDGSVIWLSAFNITKLGYDVYLEETNRRRKQLIEKYNRATALVEQLQLERLQ